MFGIAKPCRHQLTPDLRREYRAHMCGLCLSLRDGDGQLARVATNSDAIALSVLTEAQREAPLARRDAGPCPLRGMQPASVVAPGEASLAHAAGVSLLAASVVLRDHAVDGDGPAGRLPGTAVRIAVRCDSAGRRRAATAGFDPSPLDRAVERSAVVEGRPGLGFDAWSAPTEDAMAAAARHTAVIAGVPANADALDELGRMLGRITYLLDAVTDEADDVRAGRFNVLVAAFGDPAERAAAARTLFEEAMARLEAAFDRLELARPDLARHLFVDQLGRRGRRIVGGGHASCSVAGGRGAHGGHGHRHRHGLRPVAVASATVAGLLAWAVAATGLADFDGSSGNRLAQALWIRRERRRQQKAFEEEQRRRQQNDGGDSGDGCCDGCCDCCEGDCECCGCCECCDCCDGCDCS